MLLTRVQECMKALKSRRSEGQRAIARGNSRRGEGLPGKSATRGAFLAWLVLLVGEEEEEKMGMAVWRMKGGQ